MLGAHIFPVGPHKEDNTSMLLLLIRTEILYSSVIRCIFNNVTEFEGHANNCPKVARRNKQTEGNSR